MHILLATLAAAMVPLPAAAACGAPPGEAVIEPWRRVALDPDYAGAWVVAGDLDGDGLPELVSARNVDRDDVHFTSAVVAQKVDGRVLWRWGDPRVGRKKLHHDVACQICDWDGDGKNEVVLCADGILLELDGATGRERRRLPIPKDSSDCLAFVNLSGGPRATDFLVKTRYTQIWAFNRDGKQLWTVVQPGGYRTAHQAVPIDLDGDGRDEIMAGFALLNSDGSVRWTYASKQMDLKRGHLDCCRVVRCGRKPEEWRLALTMCGANGIAVCDGNGTIIWEVIGHHFESVDVGKLRGDVQGSHIAVDIDHHPWGSGPLWVIDDKGRRVAEMTTEYSRHHALVDWHNDGLDEIIIAEGRGLFDGHGKRLATFAIRDADLTNPQAPDAAEMTALVADMTGDGVPDVLLTTRRSTAVYIFENRRGTKPTPPKPSGTETNFTLY